MVVVSGAFISTPASGKTLLTLDAQTSDVAGTFTVIYYGGRYYKDVETVAFLDLEGDSYTFEPYAPEFDYRIEKGVAAKDALQKAESFVKAHYAFMRSQLSKVLDENGRVIGFELRPLYGPLAFGVQDVLDVAYSVKDGRVRIYIRLKTEVERQLFGGDGSREDQ